MRLSDQIENMQSPHVSGHGMHKAGYRVGKREASEVVKEAERIAQLRADLFNEAYVKATHTSQPADWHEAALLARQMVNGLQAHGLIEDTWAQYDEQWREDDG